MLMKCNMISETQTKLHANGYPRRGTDLIRHANIGALNYRHPSKYSFIVFRQAAACPADNPDEYVRGCTLCFLLLLTLLYHLGLFSSLDAISCNRQIIINYVSRCIHDLLRITHPCLKSVVKSLELKWSFISC